MPILGVTLLVAATQASLAGYYESNQPEMGAAIELSANGTFRYQLDYGAISETAQGRWSNHGATLTLLSDPMPVAPTYVLMADSPLAKGKLKVAVIEPQSPYFDTIDIILSAPAKERELIRIGKDETITLDSSVQNSITPLVPIIGVEGGTFALSPDRGHALALKFIANDLGSARFDHQALTIDHGDLMLTRFGVTIRFSKSPQ